MSTAQLDSVLHHLRRLVVAENTRGLTDGQLLERFAGRHDPAAFAALVQRHGPLVLGVCRHLLGSVHDAEDAFQATFLVLARQAGRVRDHNALAGWLHGVAYRTSMRAKRDAARRRAHERQARPPAATGHSESSLRELQAVLDEEVQALPEKYRAVFVLCCLEGRSTAEAVELLGWKPGTVTGRLSRARKLLLERLARRGVTLSAALTAAVLASEGLTGAARAALPDGLAEATLRASLGPEAPARAAALAGAVARSLSMGRAKALTALLLAGCLVAAGAGVLARPAPAGKPTPERHPAPAARPAAPEQVRVDRYGDPLPPGAVARLGTVRFLHGEQIQRVRFSPDGRIIVSSTYRTHRFWDAATGRQLPDWGLQPGASLLAVGNKLLAAGYDRQGILLRDVATGKVFRRLPAMGVVALSPDGKTMISPGKEKIDGTERPVLRFYDLGAGSFHEPAIPLEPGWFYRDPLALSADGKTLAVPYPDNTLQVWDVATRSKRSAFGAPGKEGFLSWSVSADGKTLATVSMQSPRRVRLWDTHTGKELPPLPRQPDTPVMAVALSPDGTMLASVHVPHTVRLWDLATRKEVRQIEGKDFQTFHAAFSPDGKRLALADNGRVRVWDVATGKQCHDFPGQTYTTWAVAFSPDGKTLASGGSYTDNVVHLWDPLTGRVKARLRGHRWGIDSLAFAPDGKLVATASQDETIRLWDPATGREVRCLEGRHGMVYGLHFFPDGRTLASAGYKTHAVHLWDVATGRELRRLGTHPDAILSVAVFPDGKTVATRGRDAKGFRLWDVASGKEVGQPRGYGGRVDCLAVSPDGRLLALGSHKDGSVTLWDPAAGREVRRVPGRAWPPGSGRPGSVEVFSVAFSPDGRAVASAYADGTVRLWEVASGKERACFEGHRGGAVRVVFSPDGNLLASGGGDQLVMIWDVTGRATAGRRAGGELSAGELESLWSDLGSPDAARGYRALKGLLAAGRQAVPFLAKHLRPMPGVDHKRLDQLIADLDSDRFAVRRKAADELRKLGEQAEPALRKVLAGRPPLEVRRQAQHILEQLDLANSPGRLRVLRALEVLEHVGTAEAREVLKVVAGGAPDAHRTRQAKASLERLARRPATVPQGPGAGR